MKRGFTNPKQSQLETPKVRFLYSLNHLKGICEVKHLKPRSWLLFLFLVILWGLNWPITKMGLSFVHPVTFLLQRFTISAVVLSPIPLLLRKRIPQDSDTLVKLTLFCLMCVLGITAMHVGLVEESSGIGAVLTYTQPLFVYCLAVPFLKERVTAIKVLGILAGFVGVVVLFLGKVGSFTFNSALIMLFAAFSWAVSVVYYKKHLSHIDPFIANFFQLPISIFPLDLLSVFTKSFVFPVDTTYLWIILYVSGFQLHRTFSRLVFWMANSRRKRQCAVHGGGSPRSWRDVPCELENSV